MMRCRSNRRAGTRRDDDGRGDVDVDVERGGDDTRATRAAARDARGARGVSTAVAATRRREGVRGERGRRASARGEREGGTFADDGTNTTTEDV